MSHLFARSRQIRRIACPSYGNGTPLLWGTTDGYQNPCRTFAEVSYALLCTVMQFATDVTAKNNVMRRPSRSTLIPGVRVRAMMFLLGAKPRLSELSCGNGRAGVFESVTIRLERH